MPDFDDSPDVIAHKLVTNTGSPARIYLEDGTLTVPIAPYRHGSPPTVDVPVAHIDAVIDRADVVDGGLNVAGFGGLHLPASEWERTQLGDHWAVEDAAVGEPFSNTSRRLEVWASREDAFYEVDPGEWSFDHLSALPDTSPLIEAWEPTDDSPDRPPVALSRPSLHLYVCHAVDADPHTRGFDRIQVGQIRGVELLDELEEWPTEPEIESPEIDRSPPPRHPEIEYERLDKLPQTDTVLDAVYTINRHAKRFDEEANTAYQLGDGAQARAYSIKKKALYRTKTVAVHRLVKAAPDQVKIARHDLNAEVEMYCLSFPGGYSFHQPIAALADELLEASTDGPLQSKRINFEPSAATQSLACSLPEALGRLADRGLDVNDYLDTTTVEEYDWGYEIPTTFEF